jgi:hypothetical protein
MRSRALVFAAWAALALGMVAAAGDARAETRRFAILAGNNVGTGARPPLRFAEEDVDKLAKVLRELGSQSGEDMWILKNRPGESVRAALRQTRDRIAAWRRRPDQRAIVLFYFSGHSDGQSLELGSERLAFLEVRRLLGETAADVRLAIVDSCRGGGLLAVKGGTPGPSFEVHLDDYLTSSGEAVITSSAADEAALESAEIRASFFSHHLVSGLRGAADASGDGQVTLVEAYQYAFLRTVNATAATVIGPQHPVYDYKLSGRGDVVLTRLQRPSALLDTPAGVDRLLLLDRDRREVLAELGPQAARRIALPAGRYVVRAWRRQRLYESTVALAPGEKRAVVFEDLSPVSPTSFLSKGPDGTTELTIAAAPAPRSAAGERAPLSLRAALGVEGAVATTLGAMPSLRLGVSPARRHAWTVAADVATAAGDGFRESRFELMLGLERRWQRRWVWFAWGAEAGGGLALQAIRGEGETRTSGVASVATLATLAAPVARGWSVALTGRLPLLLVRRDGDTATLVRPGAWLGLVVDL